MTELLLLATCGATIPFLDDIDVDGAGGGAEGDDGHCCLVLQLLLLLLLLVLPRRAAAASITRASNVGTFVKDDTGNSPNLGVNAFARVKKL